MGSGSGIVGDIQLNTELDAGQRARYQSARVVQELLRKPKVIALVGLSTEKTKASNMVASYLLDEGYQVIPIHPKATEILGQRVYPNLLSLDRKVDIVNVFRPANEVPGIVDQAMQIKAIAVWMQLKIINFEAADTALEAGLHVVMDRCIKMEHGRYGGSLNFAGMNTEVISARRRQF